MVAVRTEPSSCVLKSSISQLLMSVAFINTLLHLQECRHHLQRLGHYSCQTPADETGKGRGGILEEEIGHHW